MVDSYFKNYLGQFPAQVFDKMNENFVRCSFFELCYRYLGGFYTFAEDLKQQFPAYRTHTYVVYIVAGKTYKVWEV